jgi:predicted nucleic acid-binding protein
MRPAVDASTLIAEVLRARGRKLLEHADLDLVLATETWEETEHELRKRTILLAQRGSLSEAQAAQLLAEALAPIAARVTLVPPDLYVGQVAEAQRRILRDLRDAPTVALALTLDCGIWTGDYDFFGCGLPVWTTETLQLHLTHLAARPGA